MNCSVEDCSAQHSEVREKEGVDRFAIFNWEAKETWLLTVWLGICSGIGGGSNPVVWAWCCSGTMMRVHTPRGLDWCGRYCKSCSLRLKITVHQRRSTCCFCSPCSPCFERQRRTCENARTYVSSVSIEANGMVTEHQFQRDLEGLVGAKPSVAFVLTTTARERCDCCTIALKTASSKRIPRSRRRPLPFLYELFEERFDVMSASDQNNNNTNITSPTGFFHLPAELHNEIYTQALQVEPHFGQLQLVRRVDGASLVPYRQPVRSYRPPQQQPLEPALMRVNRQERREVGGMFYTTRRICLSGAISDLP